MNIRSKELNKCEDCGKLRGAVTEEFNGRVSVLCSCCNGSSLEKFIIAINENKFSWGRGSKYYNEDGKLMYKQRSF